MYEVTIKDHIFIAHSLKDEFFGPAQSLHGATYLIKLTISTTELIDKNVVIDIDVASKILKSVISEYNFKNLDDLPEFEGILTTTEFLAKKIVDKTFEKLQEMNLKINNLHSIKATLEESHIASAAYIKEFSK